MKGVGEAIAFSALVGSAVVLEINGREAGGLWFLIVVWVLVSSWGNRGA